MILSIILEFVSGQHLADVLNAAMTTGALLTIPFVATVASGEPDDSAGEDDGDEDDGDIIDSIFSEKERRAALGAPGSGDGGGEDDDDEAASEGDQGAAQFTEMAEKAFDELLGSEGGEAGEEGEESEEGKKDGEPGEKLNDVKAEPAKKTDDVVPAVPTAELVQELGEDEVAYLLLGDELQKMDEAAVKEQLTALGQDAGVQKQLIANLAKSYKAELEAGEKIFDVLEKNAPLNGLFQAIKSGKTFEEALILAVDFDLLKQVVDENDEALDTATRTKVIRAKLEREMQQKQQEQVSAARKQSFEANRQKSAEVVQRFASENKLEPDQISGFLGLVDGYIKDLHDGLIKPEFLNLMFKGANHESVVKTASEAAKIKGRQEGAKQVITKKSGDGLPGIKTTAQSIEAPSSGKKDPFDRLFDKAFEV